MPQQSPRFDEQMHHNPLLALTPLGTDPTEFQKVVDVEWKRIVTERVKLGLRAEEPVRGPPLTTACHGQTTLGNRFMTGMGGGGGRDALEGGRPATPSHCLPDGSITDSNRPQLLWQPPPIAYQTASRPALRSLPL